MMGMFDGLLSQRSVDFAEVLVDKIVRQFPPTSEPQLAKKGSRRRLESIVESVMGDIDAFQKEQRLGWFGKARLGNAFRWKLIERGYSKDFVEALTKGVITHVAVK